MAFHKFRHFRLTGALSAVALLAVAVAASHMAWRIKLSVGLVRQSEALRVSPSNATARLLIVGDSTAVGTGASSATNSLAGLISRDHPHITVVNRAADGARFTDIAGQLAGQEEFDIVLVLGGGNDVVRLTERHALERDIAKALELAQNRARQVVIMPPGNVGNAPFFFAPLTWLMTQRSKTLHRLVRQAAAATGAVYVNLYHDRADDPFAQRPDELNAPDGLHPSDAGYRVWYDALNSQAAFSSRLAKLR
jgi:lysophospholipase L1-like esterase